jgi:hypothetical protein
MAQQTEAACLLESGAMYGKRLLLRPPAGDPIFAGFRPGVFSLYFGDAPIYHFDGEGRWQRAFVAGTHYLKGLDATIQAIDRVREGANLVLRRRTLDHDEARDLDAQVRDAALEVLDALGVGRLTLQMPPASTLALTGGELKAALMQVAGWDAAAWSAHRERYLSTYAALPLLPPDCQGALILQATLGHAGGIAFGRGGAAEHAVRSCADFATHLNGVHRLIGRRLEQFRIAFLAGSDVLRQQHDGIESYLEAIASTFSIEPDSSTRRGRGKLDSENSLAGIRTFLDDFGLPEAGWPDWRRLCERQLRSITLGIESGSPEIRSLYHKTWQNNDLCSIVGPMKSAGVTIGVMVLVDAGGMEHTARHVEATADLINALPLGPGDLVSLLDANEVRDASLGPGVRGFTALTGIGWTEQQAELKRLLLPVRSERGAKIAPYSLEKQSASGA